MSAGAAIGKPVVTSSRSRGASIESRYGGPWQPALRCNVAYVMNALSERTTDQGFCIRGFGDDVISLLGSELLVALCPTQGDNALQLSVGGGLIGLGQFGKRRIQLRLQCAADASMDW